MIELSPNEAGSRPRRMPHRTGGALPLLLGDEQSDANCRQQDLGGRQCYRDSKEMADAVRPRGRQPEPSLQAESAKGRSRSEHGTLP